jgi:hypothetical protein
MNRWAAATAIQGTDGNFGEDMSTGDPDAMRTEYDFSGGVRSWTSPRPKRRRIGQLKPRHPVFE